MKNKVMVGLSGGVDSAVTAYLLQQEGYIVEGVYMKLHNIIDGYHEKNINTVKKITEFLNITYYILDLTDKFNHNVYNYFIDGYMSGITPNPCIKCNQNIKFGAMFDFAMEKGCEFLATGHYASTDGKFIYEAKDISKDQSYFLAQINKNILNKIIFPMSKYTKEQIKQIAINIPEFQQIAEQKDSQEICFVENDYTDILKLHTNINKKGDTLDTEGNVIGHHKGYMHYTIGKRRGFYVHGAHEPHFVKKINPMNNTIIVGKKEDLAVYTVQIDNLNMFIDDTVFQSSVKLRYRSLPISCTININKKKKTAILKLNKPIYGVACGQFAVLYDENKIVGSGVIIKTI
jgi:tRNA-specific 2-thiouridylase